MKHELLIFDFDGTLADSLGWLLLVFDDVADRFGFKRLDRSNLQALRGYDARQLLAHHQVPWWKVPSVARHLRELMQRDIARIGLFPGIEPTLSRIALGGVPLALATSNSRQNVLQVLGRQASLFRYLECGTSISGKAARLRRLLAASGAAPAATLFIGDEIRDAQAAREVGIAFGAVGWGYTHVEALLAAGAQESFATPQELADRVAGSA